MSGGLAVWYEPETAAAPAPAARKRAPELEIHVNLWRDLPEKVDFIDLGFLVGVTPNMGRLFIYVPRMLAPSDLLDLSNVLRHPTSLNAVFNDVMRVGGRREGWFDVTKADGAKFCRVHVLDPVDDLTTEVVDAGDGHVGTVITIGRGVCGRFGAAWGGKHYLRLRILLNRSAPHLFSSDALQEDFWVLSTLQRTEITEFRLNEMRSLPSEVLDRCRDGLPSVSAIHYFLIRDNSHKLEASQIAPIKIRTLEQGIWRHYLRGRPPEQDRDVHAATPGREDRLIIYHWKQAKENWSGDFHAFARFTAHRNNAWFLVGVVAVGALGSAIQAFVVDVFGRAHKAGWISLCAPEFLKGPVELSLATILVCVLALLFLAHAVASRWGRRLRARLISWIPTK